jgi:hypothetical protein
VAEIVASVSFREYAEFFAGANMLNKTNGFMALMKLFGRAYVSLANPLGNMVSKAQFENVINAVQLEDKDFNTVRFLPGTSGQTLLFNTLVEQTGLGAQ